MGALKRISFIAVIIIIFSTAMLYFLQEKLIFLPTTLPEHYQFRFNTPFEELFIETSDGALLNALHFKNSSPRGLIVYFHGNAGDLSRWGEIVQPLVGKGYDVLIMDYRTYGKSRGRLNEQVLFTDAQLFYDYALERYTRSDIILYGRSLGTGLATWVASRNQPGKLLLESPYYSLLQIAKDRFPFMPVDWLLKYRIPSHEFMQTVECPVTIFHGTEDATIPIQSGLDLYRSIPSGNKKIYRIAGGTHNNLDSFREYWEGMDEALGTIHSNKSEER